LRGIAVSSKTVLEMGSYHPKIAWWEKPPLFKTPTSPAPET